MKVIAEHPDFGRREFTHAVWDTITKWPEQGGWKRVAVPPKEVQQEETPKTQPKKGKK